MEEKSLTKEYVEELKEVEGETRGVVFKTDTSFIKEREGEEGVEKVEKKMKKLGLSFDYSEIQAMNFYPMWKRILSLLAIKEVFDLSEDEVEQMGKEAPRASLLMKMFARFFFSIEEMTKQAPDMWKKHYTVGKLEAEVSEKNTVLIRLKGVKVPLTFLYYLGGYFGTIIEMVVNSEVEVERDGYEYRCTWKDE